MKYIIAVVLAMTLIAPPVLAMSKLPPKGSSYYATKQGCYQRPYVEIPGGFWSIYLNRNGEAAKANEIWDYCRCKFNGQAYCDQWCANKDCSRFKL